MRPDTSGKIRTTDLAACVVCRRPPTATRHAGRRDAVFMMTDAGGAKAWPHPAQRRRAGTDRHRRYRTAATDRCDSVPGVTRLRPYGLHRLLRWMRKDPNHLRALPVFPVSRAGETISRSGNSVSRPVKTESRLVFPDSRPAGHEGATRLPPHSSGRHERTPTTGDFRFAQTGNYGRAMRDASPGRNVKRKKNYPYRRVA